MAAAAISSERDHVTPLAFTTDRPSTSDEEDSAATANSKSNYLLFRRRRFCLVYGGSCLAILLLVAVVLIVVALTVFKIKEPVMTMNSVTLENLNVAAPLSVNLTVIADVSVKNPNAATFRYGASATSLYYGSRVLAVAYGPPGTARAHRTVRVNVTVDVMADAVLGDSLGLAGALLSGEVEVTTSTKIAGRVKILGMFGHHVDVLMNCSLTVAVVNQSIVGQSCKQKVSL